MQTAKRADEVAEEAAWYGRVIVPINGFPPNERAIPVADALVRQHGGDVELSSMLFTGTYHADRIHLLHLLATRVHSGVFTTVAEGSDAAAYVLDLINQPNALVVFAGGTTILGIPGSMTVDVLRFASQPFIVVGPKIDSFWSGPVERIVVLLDGSSAGESSLPAAVRWATQLNARIELLQVLDADEADRASAVAPDASQVGYLKSVSDRLHIDSSVSVEYEVLHATSHERVRAITSYVGRSPTSIICMASHGSHHSSSMVGSTTLKVIHNSEVPVLLVRS
jgi:nucleotide-binding universal stress UspA family protein